MFIKQSAAEEIADALEENLQVAYSHDHKLKQDNHKSVITYLSLASNLLDEIGLEKEAFSIVRVLQKLAQHDPAIPGSSEKALSNLEHKGWMFNADDEDDDIVEDHEPDEVEID